jgi:hypothetical protein
MSRILAVCLVVSLTGISAFGQSPYESSADFAKYAMKLRDQALSKVEPQVFVPTTSRNTVSRFPWKTNIVTTIFWIGETPSGNNPVPNHELLDAIDRQLRRVRHPTLQRGATTFPGRAATEPVLLRCPTTTSHGDQA